MIQACDRLQLHLAATNDLEVAQLMLQDTGIIVLSQFLPRSRLNLWYEAAQSCFQHIEQYSFQPQLTATEVSAALSDYGFNPYSSSCQLAALTTLKPMLLQSLLGSLQQSLIADLLTVVLGELWIFEPRHAWLRKQYALEHYPRWHQAHQWHQDGSLGLTFPSSPELTGFTFEQALTSLMTVWIPLVDCGQTAPGLEILTQPIAKPVHFQYLHDQYLRQTFASNLFQQPSLTVGDVVILSHQTLHRTHVTPAMTGDRLSLELRFFPKSIHAADIL